ncbi:MAG: hypothetical protein HY904_01650 [Deltaproteobacteria bacterium]|nr:hypothetical protein [Deltaproteobacteria bacterium]
MHNPGFLFDATLEDLPRPPTPGTAPGTVKRRLRPAADLLADWLVAYGDHRDVEPLPEHVFRAYFHADAAPRLDKPTATPGVFAALVRAAAGAPSNAGGEIV